MSGMIISEDLATVPVEIRIRFGTCHYCKVATYKTFRLHKYMHRRVVQYLDCYTRDHVKPKSKQGRVTVPCCSKCNNEKGDMSAEDFIKLVEVKK